MLLKKKIICLKTKDNKRDKKKEANDAFKKKIMKVVLLTYLTIGAS